MKKIMFNDKNGLTKAVLEGIKTQTRRIMNPQPEDCSTVHRWYKSAYWKDKPYHELLGNDIKALMECDAICLCPCWEKSKGCQLEHFVAQLWDKEIIEFERLKYSKIWKEK